MPTRRPPFRRHLLLSVTAALAVPMALLNGCHEPLRAAPTLRSTRAPVVDAHLELARRHAPWVLHAADPERVRDDIPAAFDFDGDMDGGNNWHALPRSVLEPTLSYTVTATETHWFLTYHLFHPRDWSYVDLGLHMTHEGDGENLQVVVARADGRVVLLYTQAHYVGEAWVAPGYAAIAREVTPRGALTLVDDDGVPDPAGTHPVVFVQSGGHGIYGVPDDCAEACVAADGTVTFEDAGLVLRPARTGADGADGETIVEPDAAGAKPDRAWSYRLEAMPALLWAGVRDGSLVGEGRLLDGTVPYRDERRELDVPRYHEGDRFSGPFGPDRGISPFAVDFGFDAPHLGALLFDPGRRWAEALALPDPWATELVVDPFTDR